MRNRASHGIDSASISSLNITQGVAGTAIETIIGFHVQQSIRAESAKKRKQGQTIRDGFKRLKSLKASGQMIASTGDFEIGINTLEEVNCRAAIQQSIKEEEWKVKEEAYQDNIRILNNIRTNKPDENKWTKAEILAALRVVKKKGDRANPQKRDDLMTYWMELRSRIPLTTVEEESEVIIEEVREEIITSEEGFSETQGIGSEVTSFCKKDGTNEISRIFMQKWWFLTRLKVSF
jgi:hypothetical protein